MNQDNSKIVSFSIRAPVRQLFAMILEKSKTKRAAASFKPRSKYFSKKFSVGYTDSCNFRQLSSESFMFKLVSSVCS